MAINNKKQSSSKSEANIDSLNAIYGKMPPQATDIEKAVLGALLIQSDAVFNILDILKPESFYDPAHQEIFQSIRDLGTNHKPVDIITVAHELKSRDKLDIIGGEYYLADLTDKVATASHLEYHARLVHQKYIQRELIKASAEIQKRSYDESQDVEELINFAESEIFNISEGNIKSETVKLDTILGKALEAIDEAAKNKNKLLGLPSGFSDIDRITSGWQPSDLIIIAARPSMGKTAFVLSMARNMGVDHNKPIAIFSLEMSSKQLVNRLIAAESEISSTKLRTGDLQDHEWTQLNQKVKNLENVPIFIDDTPAISIFELRAKCRRLVRTHNIQGIIIDYLQLMTTGVDMKGNREQEVATISRSLKAIAKELNIPIIALSQLNRSVESRSGDKRPQLSDLRESGAIEQDADMVLFIHRPEYYGFMTNNDGESLKGLAEIIIAKHRNGATDTVKLKFKKDFAKFSDYDRFDMSDTSAIFESKMNDSAFDDGNTFESNENFDSDFLSPNDEF
ncbi:MAG: replicative DNA helicase [Bacteroidota bacterium]|jgi:replicative DNA helicase|nr:replicative DNA helicase [Bacteroidales bacterium]MDI9534616.1 replicative DNA helicase [Bacteroidota bacterium]HNY44023.1 replicative DNA helicase [Bacteroidales bacterium]HOD87912.1 replicative DNA helicase [Bacteroidales bacterium]HOE38372.1 replicative DNA helicase [Bacteroidales bacterium]